MRCSMRSVVVSVKEMTATWFANPAAVQINYTVVRDTGILTGVYIIVAGTDNAGTGLASNDTLYAQNSATGVTFGVQELAGQVSWLASTTNTGIGATLNYSVTLLA